MTSELASIAELAGIPPLVTIRAIGLLFAGSACSAAAALIAVLARKEGLSPADIVFGLRLFFNPYGAVHRRWCLLVACLVVAAVLFCAAAIATLVTA